MLKCVDSSKHQIGPTQPVLCNWCWGASSCSVSSVQVIWLRPITYWLGDRLYRCISYAYSVYSQLISLRGMFYDTFQVCPSLPFVEKPTLNRDDMNMKNYRPVSNLSFLSKILEKVVASRLNSHINSSHTSNDYQSEWLSGKALD